MMCILIIVYLFRFDFFQNFICFGKQGIIFRFRNHITNKIFQHTIQIIVRHNP